MRLFGSQTTPTNMRTWSEWWERSCLFWRERSGWGRQLASWKTEYQSTIEGSFILMGFIEILFFTIHRAPRCWTTGMCCSFCSLWRGALLTCSATSVSCRCSTPLSPHHLPLNWPVLRCCLHEHYITMVIQRLRSCNTCNIPLDAFKCGEFIVLFGYEVYVHPVCVLLFCRSRLAHLVSWLHRVFQARPCSPFCAASCQVVSFSLCMFSIGLVPKQWNWTLS